MLDDINSQYDYPSSEDEYWAPWEDPRYNGDQ